MLNDLEIETKNEGISYPEIDVDKLMNRIRKAVTARGVDINATNEIPSIVIAPPETEAPPAGELNLPARLEIPFLNLAPNFQVHKDDKYHVNDLLQYHDRDFVQNAYQAILKRQPDSPGYLESIEMLRTGRFNKIDILASLRFSEEGKSKGVTIEGLKVPSIMRSLGRVPVLGYLVKWTIGVLRLPTMVRHQAQSEAYLISQLQAVADHLNETSTRIAQKTREHRSAIGELSERAEQLSVLHRRWLHQQVESLVQLQELESFVRDAVLGGLEENNEHVRENEALLGLLSARVKQLSQIVQQTRLELVQQDSLLKASFETEGQTAGPVVSRLQKSDADRQQWDRLYALFEEKFRGDVDEIRERLRFYLPAIRETQKTTGILDLGCGYGDWLQLLKEEGFQARGVEANGVMINKCRERQLDVVEGDIFAYLRALPDQCLNIVTAFHLIEHMPFEAAFQLLTEIRRTLRPGGRVMLETPSPENLVVAACNFYSDPTHNKPIYPHTLTFLLKNFGFTDVRLNFLHPVAGSPFAADQSLEPLHMWFYGPRDYSVIAQKI